MSAPFSISCHFDLERGFLLVLCSALRTLAVRVRGRGALLVLGQESSTRSISPGVLGFVTGFRSLNILDIFVSMASLGFVPGEPLRVGHVMETLGVLAGQLYQHEPIAYVSVGSSLPPSHPPSWSWFGVILTFLGIETATSESAIAQSGPLSLCLSVPWVPGSCFWAHFNGSGTVAAGHEEIGPVFFASFSLSTCNLREVSSQVAEALNRSTRFVAGVLI